MIAAPSPTEVPTSTEQRNVPLRLSEALRLGSMTTKQAYGTWSTSDGRLCAISTLAYVYGYSNPMHLARFPEWGFLLEQHDLSSLDPDHASAARHIDLRSLIIHLNDDHRLPRQVIADRLERLGL